MRTYLIKIYTKKLDTQFEIESNEITHTDQLHEKIVDYLGKNDTKWTESSLGYIGGFFITYEEVERGKQHNVTLREENTTGIQMERDVSSK